MTPAGADHEHPELARPDERGGNLMHSGEPFPWDEDSFGDDHPDQTGDCSWCCGDGWFIGKETPGFDHINDDPEETYPCPSCRGSGRAKDQTCW